MNTKKTSTAEKGLTPEKFLDLKTSTPPKKSVGLASVFSALNHLNKYVGFRKGLPLTFKINQRKGFDCPGCAWPDSDDERSYLGEYCENGIKAISEEAQKDKLSDVFFKNNRIKDMLNWSDFEIGKSGRLIKPVIVREGSEHYEPISWEEVFKLIGDKLKSLTSPNKAIFYTSGRTSNEAAFMYQLFVRAYGTNNLPDCSNMCHESSGVALSKTVGIGKGSVTIEDFGKADLVMVFGQNPGTNHPRMLKSLEKCKQNGGKIISVNPILEVGLLNFTDPQRPSKLLTGGTNLTDLYVQIPINRDLIFTKALIKILHEEEKKNPKGVFDWDFIKEYTSDYEEFIASVEKENLETLIELSGVTSEEIQQTAKLILESENIIICWAMGLTQHKNSVNTIQEIVNLLLLKGSIGKPGAGTCPVRGHSNVQGDRTMGIWEKPKEAFLEKLDSTFGIKSPRDHGLNVVEAIENMLESKAKVLFAMGGNLLSAAPDTEATAKALRNCDLTVHVSTKLNRSHLIHGKTGIILPCKGRTDKDFQNGKEQFITVESSTGYISASRGLLQPPSKKLKSEHEIIAKLAMATLNSDIDWKSMYQDYTVVRDYIGKVIPVFESFNEKISLEKGFYLKNGAREREFNTSKKKAVFTVNEVERAEVGDGEFLMMTIRSHDQFNTTIYGNNDRYRGIKNERRVVLMNEEDAKSINLNEREVVNLTTEYEGKKLQAYKFMIVYYNIPRRCIATYFPEANALVPLSEFARESQTPVYKSIRVKIKKNKVA